MSRRDRSKLSTEERELWAKITRSVAPLRHRRPSAAAAAIPASPGPSARKAHAPAAVRTAPVTRAGAGKPSPTQASPLESLDRRLKQRLARGTQTIDGRLDLHGKTQNEAHAALIRFLRRAQRDGARFVLVITGKGGRGRDAGEGGGVLKRQVPLWLHLPDLRPYVAGFETAHVGHGGEGALYVRIRKPAISAQ
jgi:DNA-nicking Smr family endonuclease